MCPECHGDNEMSFKLPYEIGGGNDTEVDAWSCQSCGYEWIETPLANDDTFFEPIGFYVIFSEGDDCPMCNNTGSMPAGGDWVTCPHCQSKVKNAE